MNDFRYRGFTTVQLDAMIDRDRARQQIMLNAEPITITPPALFTPEMLEQIRAVVREELQSALGEEEEPATVKPIQFDSETKEQSPVLEIETAYMGKLYKGVLYFVKDVE